MKVIGLIGGMSWESSLEYYRLVNEGVRRQLGGHASAKVLMYSLNFQEMERAQSQGDWKAATRMVVEGGRRLAAGGADMLLICCNTMHMAADDLAAQVKLPLLHMADCIGREARDLGMDRVGLLGTRYTMEQSFYKNKLLEKYDLEVLVPPKKSRDQVHQIIYQELCQGIISRESKKKVLGIINGLEADGAYGVILGCTELSLLIASGDAPLPILDSTALHAAKAVEWALAETPSLVAAKTSQKTG
jgi:aspartate racemase